MAEFSLDFEKPVVRWVSLILLSLIWGSSFILIKHSITVYTPMQVGALRISISALCFLPIFLNKIRQFERDKLFFYLTVAFCGSGIPAFLYPLAQQHVESGVAGILNGLTPLLTLLLSVVVFGKVFKKTYLVGVLFGLVGVIMLSTRDINQAGIDSLFYYILILVATFCYATSVNTIEHYLKYVNPIRLSASTFVLIGPFGIVYLLQSDFLERMSAAEGAYSAFGAVFLLAFFGTFLSTMLFFYMVQKTDAVFASLVAYLIPVVALAWGIFAGESVGLIEALGLLMILSGVYVAKRL